MLGSVTCNHLLRELILHDPSLHIYVFHGGDFKVLQSGRDLLFPLRVIKLVAREFPDQEPVSRFFMRPQLTFCKNSFSVTLFRVVKSDGTRNGTQFMPALRG